MFPETEYAWAAGFIDGEGTSYCNVQRRTNAGGTTRSWTTLHLTVGQAGVNGEPTALLRLQKLFGGKIYANKPRLDHPGWKPTYKWNVWSQEARQAMARMLPYLDEVKVEQYSRALEKERIHLELKAAGLVM